MCPTMKLAFLKLQYSTINLYSFPNIPVKANRNQNAMKLTASKIGTHVMIQVTTKYGQQCLHQVVTHPKEPSYICQDICYPRVWKKISLLFVARDIHFASLLHKI